MNLLFKIYSIMEISRKANNGGITRWSIYDMLTRYKKLHPYFLQMVTDIEDNITLSIGKNKIIR